jgi:hypothetical protein
MNRYLDLIPMEKNTGEDKTAIVKAYGKALPNDEIRSIMGSEVSNMVSKADFKSLFQSSLKEMLSKKEKQKNDKKNMELNDDSLDMNVFDKCMEGERHKIGINNDDVSTIIANTNNLFHFEKPNEPDKSYLKNNNKT